MNRFRFLIFSASAILFAAASIAPTLTANAQAMAGPSSVTGTWNTEVTGEVFKSGVLKLTQVGSTVTGSAPAASGGTNQLSGTFTNEVLKGTWRSAGSETGWFTLFFSADGKGFAGEWGYHGRPPNGRVTGTRVAAAGKM